MSAAARAEARRKAILSRGNDRLAKLTTSARGEDAPAYMHDKQPPRSVSASLGTFVGEESNDMPPPPMASSQQTSAVPPPLTASGLASSPPDPSVWSQEQQNQFLQALMAGALNNPPSDQPHSLPSFAPNTPSQEDQFASIMSNFPQLAPQGPAGSGKTPAAPPSKAATRFQKLLPLLHMLGTWFLIAFFVFWKEPESFAAQTHGAITESIWSRWAQLSWKNITADRWGVQFVPFLWSFVALQVLLQSIRIFLGFGDVQPPMLLVLALPSLPPPFPSLIINGLRYIQLASSLFDGLAAAIFGIGIVVLISSWVAE